ncbi:MAG: SCO family protein [Candidatus Eremiobacteraeota bacterium]|nr:SCO family protein [Candidatus Eremiobacteraeota bacterium]
MLAAHAARLLAIATMALIPAACAHSSSASGTHGTLLTPAPPAKTFALPATSGRRFDLAQSRGRLVVLYFGFTHCKDTCPLTLTHIDAAIRAAHVPSVRAVFVTVDPQRDTLASERSFFTRSDVRAIGVAGTRAQLAPIWKAYGVSAQRQKHDIAHSDYIYLVDAEGRFREVLHADVSIADLASDLRALAS